MLDYVLGIKYIEWKFKDSTARSNDRLNDIEEDELGDMGINDQEANA